jgi:hypothetical protein
MNAIYGKIGSVPMRPYICSLEKDPDRSVLGGLVLEVELRPGSKNNIPSIGQPMHAFFRQKNETPGLRVF